MSTPTEYFRLREEVERLRGNAVEAGRLSRVVLVDESGTVFDRRGLAVALGVHDDGQTLTVSVRGGGRVESSDGP